jgi:hypothetical protein
MARAGWLGAQGGSKFDVTDHLRRYHSGVIIKRDE